MSLIFKYPTLLYAIPMIGKLSGIYSGEAGDGAVLVDVNGVGYVVRMPAFNITGLPTEGTAMSLYIHTAVREDAIDLYGFPSRDALGFFKTLMSVSGIGPKTALGIMSGSDVPSLRQAISRGDTTSLVKLYGISKKNSERIVVELKDKILLSAHEDGGTSKPVGALGDDTEEILEALGALGYTAVECRNAVRNIPATAISIQERLAFALKEVGAPRRG